MKKLGWQTEDAFRKMLDRDQIPYLPFCENMEKFSPALRDIFLSKRPDILILLRYIGYLIVDVKHKKISNNPDFLFDCDEVEKYSRFRESFGHEVWYAISSEDAEFKEWYFIPSLEVMKNHKTLKTKNGNKCYVVPHADCIRITSFAELVQSIFRIS